MRGILVWLIVGYIALELLCFSVAVQRVGLLVVLVEVIGSALLGLWILKRLARLDLLALFVRLGQRDALSLMQSSMLSALGALLLVLPGIMSDLIGVVLLAFALWRGGSREGGDTARGQGRGEGFQGFHTAGESSGEFRERFGERFTHSRAQASEEEIIDVEVLEPESRPQTYANPRENPTQARGKSE